MSSLKDIMDVDVEPLEAQAYRRSKEAAQRLASQPFSAQAHSIQASSETPQTPIPLSKEEALITRRTSSRTSMSSRTLPTLSQFPPDSQLNSHPTEGGRVDFTQNGESNHSAASMSPQHTSTQVQRTTEIPLKYTPVTGRISRAKKGVPVHTCDICRPVKTFTRAEHLRRHQLSHQRPAYPCTFEDCERAFHRPDLLARHQHRHESQGEKPYKAGRPRSRASSCASDSQTFSTTMGESSQSGLVNPTNARPPADTESSLTASSSNTVTGNFQAVNYSSAASSKRNASQAHLADPGLYGSSSIDDLEPQGSFSQAASSFDTGYSRYRLNPSEFSPTAPSDFLGLYNEGGRTQFSHYTTPPLPLLKIPEHSFSPGLSYTQESSPWCSSASDSTYSTQSEGSRNGPQWHYRGRSTTGVTMSEWPATATPFQWPAPHTMNSEPQDTETMMGQLGSPYSSPTPSGSGHRHLRIPNFGGYYQMDSDTMESTQQPAAMTICQNITAEPPTNAQLDGCLSNYWQFFNRLFPIIHHATFDPSENSLLRSAMVAIGDQYGNNSDTRVSGTDVRELCRREFGLCLHLTLEIMQAIVLNEIFTRFRGRKTNVRASQEFAEVYNRLVNSRDKSTRKYPDFGPLGMDSPQEQPVNELQSFTSTQRTDIQTEWIQWVASESKVRLLGACFVVDIHRAFFHEQPRSKRCHDQALPLLQLPCSDDLWNAKTASEWQSLKSEYSLRPHYVLQLNLSSTSILGSSPLTESLLICFLASRLPPRCDPNFPNEYRPDSLDPAFLILTEHFSSSLLTHTYLALYHTPLHDLLAIAGDTWVFSQKITPPSKFRAAQSRLKTWSTSPSAAIAIHHACHALRSSLSQATNGPQGLSHYWGLYISALICWAFGNRYQTSLDGNTVSDVEYSSENYAPPAQPLNDALIYIDSMLDLNVNDLLTNNATRKGETSGVIDAIKARLEETALGNDCAMLVDAISVLGRLKKGNGKWF